MISELCLTDKERQQILKFTYAVDTAWNETCKEEVRIIKKLVYLDALVTKTLNKET